MVIRLRPCVIMSTTSPPQSRTRIAGECEMYKEERDVLQEMRKIDECDMETFGTLDGSEKTSAVLRGR